MKLVDILARELKAWPEGAESLSQSFGGMVFFVSSVIRVRTMFRTEISEDWRESSVTRAQWQAAVDALKAENCAHLWVGWSDIEACELCNKTRKIVVEWNGEGLPPVGVDALLAKECKFTEGTLLESFPAGTVVYVGGRANFGGCDLAVIIIKGRHFCGTIIPELLNPIRTPEQIGAAELDRQVTIAIEDLAPYFRHTTKNVCCAQAAQTVIRTMIHNGYRKFEIVDN